MRSSKTYEWKANHICVAGKIIQFSACLAAEAWKWCGYFAVTFSGALRKYDEQEVCATTDDPVCVLLYQRGAAAVELMELVTFGEIIKYVRENYVKL